MAGGLGKSRQSMGGDKYGVQYSVPIASPKRAIGASYPNRSSACQEHLDGKHPGIPVIAGDDVTA